MSRKRRAVRSLIIAALVIGPACSVNPPDDGNNDSNANDQGGTSGTPGSQLGSAGKAKSGGAKGTVDDEVAGGGEGGQASQCPGCASGFCLQDGTCVDCLPSNDHCPAGQYCTDHHECAAGCKDNTTSCASGVCGEAHNCERCISDSECTGKYICSGGECTAACGSDAEGKNIGCSSGKICCSERCSDLAVDSQNCGACGNACASGQFCGLTNCTSNAEGGAAGAGGAAGDEQTSCVECHDTTLANVCSVAKVIVILDTSKNSSDGNRAPGRAIGAALRDQCLPKPQLTEAEQDGVDALNLTTGRPVSDSSELLVVAGGPFYQNLEGYLEEQKIAPLQFWDDGKGSTAFRKSGTNEVVVSLPTAGDHDSHDFFIVQFMRDPASGSLVLNVQGLWLSGTVAGTYQLTHALLPELAQQAKAWYAYEWTDRNGDKAPDLNEIELLAAGH